MLNDNDLDKIEMAMQALVDAYEKQGKILMFAYYAEVEGGETYSHVISTPSNPEHYLDAVSQWSSISADHVNNHLTDDKD